LHEIPPYPSARVDQRIMYCYQHNAAPQGHGATASACRHARDGYGEE
jgi:hypothetical protein